MLPKSKPGHRFEVKSGTGYSSELYQFRIYTKMTIKRIISQQVRFENLCLSQVKNNHVLKLNTCQPNYQ